jgi:hypothetical protein
LGAEKKRKNKRARIPQNSLGEKEKIIKKSLQREEKSKPLKKTPNFYPKVGFNLFSYEFFLFNFFLPK